MQDVEALYRERNTWLAVNPYKPGVLFMEYRQKELPYGCDGVPSGTILFANIHEIK